MINPLKERRFGKVCMTNDFLESLTSSQIHYVFLSLGIVVGCSMNYVGLVLEYIVANIAFEPLSEGHKIPQYLMVLKTKPVTKEITEITWERLDNG